MEDWKMEYLRQGMVLVLVLADPRPNKKVPKNPKNPKLLVNSLAARQYERERKRSAAGRCNLKRSQCCCILSTTTITYYYYYCYSLLLYVYLTLNPRQILL